jgi:pimeloyl-ACP methyl ester carboxylesterase
MERDALRATVDQLGLETFDLVGWSLGAHVSLAFAMEYPERVRTLTLIEPPSFWVLRAAGQVIDGLSQVEAADRAVSGKQITVDDLKNFLARTGLGQPDAFETMPSWPVWVRNRQSISIVGTLWDYSDSLDRLRRLAMPVLGVRGTETAADLAAIVEQVLVRVPHGRLLELPGGHACHLQNMDRFMTALANHTTAVHA